jgi:hypothetical protein
LVWHHMICCNFTTAQYAFYTGAFLNQ